jgi:hypothetical protein
VRASGYRCRDAGSGWRQGRKELDCSAAGAANKDAPAESNLITRSSLAAALVKISVQDNRLQATASSLATRQDRARGCATRAIKEDPGFLGAIIITANQVRSNTQ